jgi:hypothetical protein
VREDERHANAHYLLAALEREHEPGVAREHFRVYLDLEPRGRHAADVRGQLRELALSDSPAVKPEQQPEATGDAADTAGER